MSWAKRNLRRISTPAAPGMGTSPEIIPIRGPSPGDHVTGQASHRDARASSPVETRPWRLLLVPPSAGAPTLSFLVARWQARLAVAVLALLLLIAGGAATAVVIALYDTDLFASSADVASLRDRLLAVEDSLSLARAAFADAAEPARDRSVSPDAPGARIRSGAIPVPPRAPFARMRAARAVASDVRVDSATPGPLAGLPVIGLIASRFSSARRHPLLHIIRPHLGVDISAARGTSIAAPAAGRVSFVGWKFGYGLVIEIDHGDGVLTRYAHCSEALVRVDDRVARGALIGTVGSSGLTTGPHLHYEVWVHEHAVNPLRFRLPQVGDSTSAVGTRTGAAAAGGVQGGHEDPTPGAAVPPPR